MKLNIGCETEYLEGYINIDCDPQYKSDRCERIEEMNFSPNSVDEIYASHVIEHLPLMTARKVLRNFKTWLKQDGKWYISVPDMEVVGRLLGEGCIDEYLFFWTWGGVFGDSMRHHWGYTERTLRTELARSGLRVVGKFEPRNERTGRTVNGELISLNLWGTK